MNFAKIRVKSMGNIVGFYSAVSMLSKIVRDSLHCERTNLDIWKIATFLKELASVPSRTQAAIENPTK